MTSARFNQVFITLLALGAAAAFLLPMRHANLLRGRIDGLFSPVSYPARRIAETFTGRWRPNAELANYDLSSASPDAARQEIDRLHTQVANLTVQLAELKQLAAGRQLMGDANKYSMPFKVVGGDQGTRQSLLLDGTSADGLAVGMPVVHRDGLVGAISAAGAGGAQVRLITDRGFRVTASFGRFRTSADGKVTEFVLIATPPPLAEGAGNGTMTITNIRLRQLQDAGVAEGDWVVLRDEDWPMLVNGYFLGRVDKIDEWTKARLFGEVTLRPRVNLSQLREAMVVMNGPAAPPTPLNRQTVQESKDTTRSKKISRSGG